MAWPVPGPTSTISGRDGSFWKEQVEEPLRIRRPHLVVDVRDFVEREPDVVWSPHRHILAEPEYIPWCRSAPAHRSGGVGQSRTCLNRLGFRNRKRLTSEPNGAVEK